MKDEWRKREVDMWTAEFAFLVDLSKFQSFLKMIEENLVPFRRKCSTLYHLIAQGGIMLHECRSRTGRRWDSVRIAEILRIDVNIMRAYL